MRHTAGPIQAPRVANRRPHTLGKSGQERAFTVTDGTSFSDGSQDTPPVVAKEALLTTTTATEQAQARHTQLPPDVTNYQRDR